MSSYYLIPLVVGVTLLTSFCCSLMEACIYSVSRSRIETLKRIGDPSGRVLDRVRHHIEETIAAILIVNTIANTAGAAWAGALVLDQMGSRWMGGFSAVLTFCILFFSEITPKSLGVRYANQLAPVLAYPLQGMIWCLWPVTKACVFFTRLWGKGARISHGTEEDIISLAELVARQGAILPHESLWVANALRLNDFSAYDLMTPNPVVARVPVGMSLEQTKVNADHWRFSRLPVCDDHNPDRIVGMVRRRRIFNALAQDEFHKTMSELMEPVEFVPETMPAHELLDRFLQKRRHLFCVQDGDGCFTGVVSLEDVLECLLGQEIVDETDLHEDMQEVARRRKDALLAGKAGRNEM